MNILHIEQSKLIREATINVVEKIGHKFFQAVSSKDVFEIIETQDIQLIITCLELADISVVLLIEALNNSKYKDIPIIVLTSKDSLEIRKKLFNLGVVDYLVKDGFSEERLKRYIENFVLEDDIYKKMKKMKIAVLDDNILVRSLIKNIFKINGIINVDLYDSAESLFDSKKEYDIYILDLILPGMSGEDVILKIRSKQKNSVIILISSISNYKTITNILNSGADDYIMKPFDSNIFMARIKAQVRNYILFQELEESHQNFEKLAITDGLTQLYNHKFIMERLENEIKRAYRYKNDLSILLFDIDDFKKINDIYGHQVGDEVLKKLAYVIKNAVRQSDIVGRYGGEEFMVILPETNEIQGRVVAEKIRAKIESTKIIDQLNVTISGGGVEYHHNDHENIIKIADERLYKAKKTGKNKIVFE